MQVGHGIILPLIGIVRECKRIHCGSISKHGATRAPGDLKVNSG